MAKRRAFGSAMQRPGRSGWYVKYLEPGTGKRVFRLAPDAKTRADAEEFLGEIRKQLGEDADGRRGPVLTLDAFAVSHFIPALRSRGKSDGHIRNVVAQLAQAARHLGDVSMRDVTKNAAQDYIDALGVRGWTDSRAAAAEILHEQKAARAEARAVAAGLPVPKPEPAKPSKRKVPLRGLSPAAVHRHASALRTCWDEAMKRGVVRANPWSAVTLPKVKTTERPYMDPACVRRLYSAMPDEIRDIMVVAFETGARISEVLGLSWNFVDVANDFASVRLRKTKTGIPRDVFTTPAVADVLRRAHERRSATPITGEHLVFPGIDRKTVLQRFQATCARLKLPRFRVHDARHFCATVLVQSGCPVTDVARVLGHTTAQLVLTRYGHHAPDSYAQRAAAAMAATMSPPAPRSAAAGA